MADMELTTRKLRKLSPCGYTLIEILIVVVMVAVVVGAGMAAYAKFNKTQTQKQAILNFTLELRRVQKMADVNEGGCEGFGGYQVQASQGSNVATVTEICSTPDSIPDINLGEAVRFYDNVTVIFLPLGQGVDYGAEFTFGDSEGDELGGWVVNVTEGGVISTSI